LVAAGAAGVPQCAAARCWRATSISLACAVDRRGVGISLAISATAHARESVAFVETSRPFEA
jgi:hypothetical protein